MSFYFLLFFIETTRLLNKKSGVQLCHAPLLTGRDLHDYHVTANVRLMWLLLSSLSFSLGVTCSLSTRFCFPFYYIFRLYTFFLFLFFLFSYLLPFFSFFFFFFRHFAIMHPIWNSTRKVRGIPSNYLLARLLDPADRYSLPTRLLKLSWIWKCIYEMQCFNNVMNAEVLLIFDLSGLKIVHESNISLWSSSYYFQIMKGNNFSKLFNAMELLFELLDI